ncbi:MAG: hypothetical protein ABJA74_07170 [Lapillicoccus sp.]
MRWAAAGSAGPPVFLALAACGGAPTPATTPSAAASGTGDPAYVIVRLRTGTQPCGILGAAGKVWVSNYGDSTLVSIDPTSCTVSAPVTVGASPCGLAFGAGSIWGGELRREQRHRGRCRDRGGPGDGPGRKLALRRDIRRRGGLGDRLHRRHRLPR